MSETNAKTIEQLTAEMHLLRAAVAELAVVQAEALNAVAKHLTENNPSPLAAHMLGKHGRQVVKRSTLPSVLLRLHHG